MTIINNISSIGSNNNISNSTKKIDISNYNNINNNINSNILQSNAKSNTNSDNTKCVIEPDIYIGGMRLPKAKELPYCSVM